MEKSESKFGDLCIIHIGYPWGWSWFHKSVSHAPLILTARSRLMCMKQSRDHQNIQSVVFIVSSLLSCRNKSLPFADSFANQSIWWSYEFANTDHNLTSSYNLKNHINFPFQASQASTHPLQGSSPASRDQKGRACHLIWLVLLETQHLKQPEMDFHCFQANKKSSAN